MNSKKLVGRLNQSENNFAAPNEHTCTTNERATDTPAVKLLGSYTRWHQMTAINRALEGGWLIHTSNWKPPYKYNDGDLVAEASPTSPFIRSCPEGEWDHPLMSDIPWHSLSTNKTHLLNYKCCTLHTQHMNHICRLFSWADTIRFIASLSVRSGTKHQC